MKITSKQYAETLYQAVQSKKDGQVKGVIEKFVQVLVNNNDTSKADQIVEQFTKIWNREKGIVEAEVVSARELNDSFAKNLGGEKCINLTFCSLAKLFIIQL